MQQSTLVDTQMYGYGHGYEYDTHKNSIYHRLRNILVRMSMCVRVNMCEKAVQIGESYLKQP